MVEDENNEGQEDQENQEDQEDDQYNDDDNAEYSYEYEDDEEIEFENKNAQVLVNYCNEFNIECPTATMVHRDSVEIQSFFYLYFPISELQLDHEHCNAMNLNVNCSIRVEFIVDTSNSRNATIKIVRITNYDSVADEASELEFSWVLSHRISEYVKELAFNLDEKESARLKMVKEIMENTNCTELKARSTLEDVGWNVNEATNRLLDCGSSGKKEVIDLSADDPPPQSPTRKDSRFIDSSLAKLSNLFGHIDFDVLSSLFRATGYEYATTVSYLESTDASLVYDQYDTTEFRDLFSSFSSSSSSSNSSSRQEAKKARTTPSKDQIDMNTRRVDLKSTIEEVLRESPHYTAELYKNHSNNKFVILYLLIEGEIMSCGNRCLICNTPVSYPGIRPVVCGNELCIMSYEELGVGVDLQHEIIANQVIIDFFISLLYFGTVNKASKRLDLMFPRTVKAYANNVELGFTHMGVDGNVCHNYDLLLEVINSIPSIETMVNWSQNRELKKKLDEIHVLIYPLLSWLIRSNRTYLRLLGPDEIPQGIKAKKVFALTSGPMEKEIQFQKLRHENNCAPEKSLFFFHGSALQNWHSILRLGLKNFSNTQYMSNGAAYGPGVYFSSSLAYSSGYSQRQLPAYNSQVVNPATTSPTNTSSKPAKMGWQYSTLFEQNDCVLAICEIINKPNEFKQSGEIYVVKNEEYIATRFLMISPAADCVKFSKDINCQNMRQSLSSLHSNQNK